MAWNQPASNNNSAARKASKSSPSLLKGLVAGLLVVAIGAVVAFYLLSGKGERPVKVAESKKPSQIAEVKPAVAPTNDSPVTKAKATPWWLCEASETNGFTEAQVRRWKLAHRPLPKVMPVYDKPRARCAIFKHFSENAIAGLVTHEPGAGMIGTPVYGEKFEKDFMDSCNEPILEDKDDDDYARNLKKQMKDIKIELRQRMSDGESLSQILLDTHRDLQRLAVVKREIENDMRTMIKQEAKTESDVESYIQAANKLLEQKGAAPIKSNRILTKSLMRLVNKEN